MAHPRIALRACATAAVTLASLIWQQGCSSTVQEQIELARLAQSCLVNSDCSDPLVCAFEACHAECESSRDCDDGARCVAAARPYKVCQLETERACQRTSDCPAGLVCGIDGECRDKCLSDVDCVEGQLCVSGTCADRDELDDAGRLVPAPGASYGEEGSPCVYVSDCSESLLCRSQACLPECKADKDCGAARKCEQTRCVADGSLPLACTYSSECNADRGERCLGGSCLCLCVEDRDCPASEQCDGCGCEPKPDAPGSCVYNSDCESAGQICRSGTCDCECKTDADCGDDKKCDGCGCFDVRDPVDGIVLGGVQIESALELPRYRGVVEIHGDLIIGGVVLGDLGDTFAELRSIEGSLVVQQTQKLAKLSFPALEYAAALTFSDNLALEVVELDSLKSSVISINQAQQLSTLSLAALEAGSLQLTRLAALKELRLPSVSELSQFQVHECNLLETIELPELTRVGGPFQIKSLTSTPQALSTLFAPKLASTGHAEYAQQSVMVIANTQLTTLDDFMKAPTMVHSTGVQITSNASLSSCAVAVFLARCQAKGLKATADTFGNVPCTACQGAMCCDNAACPE